MTNQNISTPIHLPIFQRYWIAYGGWKTLRKSRFLYLALFLTALLYPYWLNDSWWETALSVLPNLLGFSIGGFVMWLGFGNAAIKEALHRRDPEKGVSVYLGVSAVFAHFVLIQAAALILAVIAKATNYPIWKSEFFLKVFSTIGIEQYLIVNYFSPIAHGVGFFFFIYSVTTVIEAALAVFRVASWHDHRH